MKIKFHTLFNSLAFVALIASWLFAGFHYNLLPESVPVHFNHQGEPDGYGKAISIFISPAIATCMFLFLLWLTKRPQKLNYPVKITNENALQQTQNAKWFLGSLNLGISILFFLIVFYTSKIAMGELQQTPKWIVFYAMISFLGPLFVFLIRASHLSK